jgi:hypothetical protein
MQTGFDTRWIITQHHTSFALFRDHARVQAAFGAILLHNSPCTWSHFTTHSTMHLEPFYHTIHHALGAILLQN